jgi:hypothetical protein
VPKARVSGFLLQIFGGVVGERLKKASAPDEKKVRGITHR